MQNIKEPRLLLRSRESHWGIVSRRVTGLNLGLWSFHQWWCDWIGQRKEGTNDY